ncbi:YihY/virulence factor BrkB family protein [Saltatorellus ferox]|uniref:YihY/virulence factor BrkB family protein n=1 Tax=Saltatorellus ferox TaxID=2528018 RepID=UPI003AF36C29
MTEPKGNKPAPGAPDLRGTRRLRPEPRGRIESHAVGLHTFFTRDLWSRELASLPTFRRWGYGVARVIHLTITNFVKDRCSWRAAALTYITVLSLVPMLALGFSVAKGLGAYETLLAETIIPFLDSTFGPADGAPTELEELGVTSAKPAPTPEAAPAGEQGSEIGEDTAVQDGDSSADQESGDLAPVDPARAEADFEEAIEEGLKEEFKQQGGSEVRRAIDTVLGFVQKTDVSRLGVLGLLIVVWTVIQLLGAIEKSFNDIWGVTKSRSLPRKLADYLSTIVLVPLLLVTGTGILGLVRSGWLNQYMGGGEGPVFAIFGSLAPLTVIWIGFAFAYILMPNTRTRVTSALVGGVIGGTMWQLFQFAHLKLQVGVANYNAIYSTFAALPIFLFWVHSSWMTVLLGAEAAAAHQNQARHGQLVRSRNFDLALKETIALRLAVRVTRVFLAGGQPHSMDDLAVELGCPERTIEEVSRKLERARILAIVESEPDDPALVLASDPDRVRMQHVFDALKGDALDARDLQEIGAFDEEDGPLGEAFGRFRRMQDRAEENLSLRELARTGNGTALLSE